jgi:hypothetical protein
MKNFLLTLSLLLLAGFAFAQGNGNQGSFVVSEFKIIEGSAGAPDQLEIRLSGPAANEVPSLIADPTYATRVSTITFDKSSGSGNGNGATSLWRASVDASALAGPDGEVVLELYGGCCCCVTGAIVVRLKLKK